MKLTVSVSDADFVFLNKCVDEGGYASWSAVIARALRLLRAADLGKMYDEAFVEWQAGVDSADWEQLDAALRLHLWI